MISVQIGGRNVNEHGALKTVPEKPSTAKAQNMDLVNTAYNFVIPMAGQQFFITGFIVSTDKDVGVNGSAVIIYEASSLTSTTADKVIFEIPMLKNEQFGLAGLMVEVTEGKWVNAKHDDDDVFVTILGYYEAAPIVHPPTVAWP